MIIQHAMLHILDTNTGNLIASQGEMPLDNVGVQDYIDQLVAKVSAGDVKQGTLTPQDYLATILAKPDFAEMTTALATKLFEIIAASDSIPAGDVLSFLATSDEGPIFGLLKLNFSPRYAHAVTYIDDQMVNNLVLNQTVLPASSQTVDEAIIVNLTTQCYQLLEKKYVIDGHRCAYFSEKFLALTPEISLKENIQTIKRTVKAVAEKFDDIPTHEALATTQAVIYDGLSTGQIDTTAIAEQVFPDNVTAQAQYQAQLIDKSVAPKVPVDNTPKYEKKYRVQKFKLDSGIEVAIPMAVYQDRSKVEFINHDNGTISLVIKDIEQIANKFSGWNGQALGSAWLPAIMKKIRHGKKGLSYS